MVDRYRVVCDSCEVDELWESLERAQSFFTEHATDGCEVALRNTDATAYSSTGEPARSEANTESRTPVD